MSNLLQPVESQILEAVTGGAATTPRCTSSSSNDQILQTLTSLSSTIKDLGTNSNRSGFSSTEMMMLGLMMSQRSQVNVFVRRPYW
jgi:hypothetical protein